MNNNPWYDAAEMDNLIPYTHPSAAWTARHSSVCLAWTDEHAVGLQRLQILYGWGGTLITESLLRWTLSENGRQVDLVPASRTYRPDRVTEIDEGEGITVTASAVYADRNVVRVDIVLENSTDRKREIELSFMYSGKGNKPNWEGMFPVGEIVEIDTAPTGSWSTLFTHSEHGRNFGWVKPYVSGVCDGTSFELVCFSDCTPRTFRLSPAGEARTTILLAFGLNQGTAKRLYSLCSEQRASGPLREEENTDLLAKLVYSAAPLPQPYADNLTHRRMYVHGIAGLNSLFIRGDGGYTGHKRIPWTTTFGLAIAFFWDTAFSCMGALEFSPELSREAISCFTENATPRGSMPGTLCDTHRAGEGQAPVMTWAAWLTFRKTPDVDWLRKVYPALCGYNRFWFTYHVSDRGLAKFYNAGQIGDNDVRFDPVYGRPQGNEPLYGFESPDLNALFVVEMRCLANMADALGKPEEAETWRTRADVLAALIVKACYFPEHAMFFDVREGTHEPFSGTKGPNMFLPLLADVPLEEQEIRAIIEKHMLNPAEFYRELPYPSVSYDNPKYDPNGYWRGRIWPHIVFLMAQILWKHGYHEQAEETAHRLLMLLDQTPWFHENYNSAEANGLGLTDDGYVIGFPEYNWAQATVIRLMLERYKETV